MNNDESIGIGAGIILLGFAVAFLTFIVVGSLNISKLRIIKEDMESVGIERFVRCNNSHSNWVEIVWKEKK